MNFSNNLYNMERSPYPNNHDLGCFDIELDDYPKSTKRKVMHLRPSTQMGSAFNLN